MPVPHANKEDNAGLVRSVPERITKSSTEKMVGVPVPHIKKEIVDVPVEVLRKS